MVTYTSLYAKYDRAASTWHQSLGRFQFLDAYARLMTHLDRAGVLAGLPHCARVLDAGVGTGALSVALAQHNATCTDFTGVDISHKMLREARYNLEAVGVSPCLQPGSITALDFADASFDIVMNAHVLEHLPDPAHGLHELVRVLRPGAPLLTVTSRWCPFTMLQQGWWRYRIIPYRRLVCLMGEAGLTGMREIVYADARHIRHMSRAVIAFKRT